MLRPQAMIQKTGSQPRTLRHAGEVQRVAIDSGGSLSRARWYLGLLSIALILTFSTSATAAPLNNAPILISEATSTRGIAVESLTLTREPFVLTSPYGGLGQRARVMVFAMDLTLQTGEDLSVVSADAEDAAHRHYPLIVESIRPVPSYESLSAVVFRLNDDLGDVGDVLISVSYRGVRSNRVRIAIGHIGGGPPNDAGAVPTPALPYTISGQLTGNGPSLAGASITLSGPQSGTAVTDASGFYSFRVAQIGEYTLTPAPNPYYTFVSPTFTNVGFNHIVNLPGTLRFYTIAGAVQLGPNAAAFMEIPISGSLITSVTTDALGRFSISLPAGGNYTFTFAQTYYTFSPATWPITDLKADQLTLFIQGTRQSFTISGKLKGQDNVGLPGITVNLTGAAQQTTVSDANGNYQFPNLLAGYNYTVTPPSTASYTFPAGQNVNDLRDNQVVDFVGLRRLLLSGRIKDQNGNGIFGVKVTLSGTESASTTTAPDGSYSLMATATGNYSVTPSILQSWYNFAPSELQFNNLADAHVTDFIATLAAVPDPAYVLEFDGTPKTVDYGNFWHDGVDLGHFYWEFWAMPASNAGATYMLSDGYGGAHALLFGVGSFNSSESNRYELLGNIFDGVRFDYYFGSDVGPAEGEWGHFGVGWDGQNIITYFNGVPVGKTPFVGPRRTPGPGGGGGRLMIGGSDHSNFAGRIAQVRGYEDQNPREDLRGGVEASFAPQTVFGVDGNLLSYYFRSGPRVADLSHGYNAIAHEGNPRGTTFGVLVDCPSCPPPQFVVDPTAPNFATGAPPSPVNVPPATAPPGGALVFDSFARPNSTYTFGGQGGLGSTEGGSAGTQVWQTSQAPANPQPFGILNARVVLLANSTSVAWVPTNSVNGNLDIRVNRYNGRWGSGKHTGLSFRVKDAQNFFFAYTASTGDAGNPNTVRVGYYLNGQRVDLATGATMPVSWTTLRVVTTNSGELKVYVDASLVFSTNSPLLISATGAGLYNNSSGLGLVNRWDNFTVFAAP